MPPYLFIVGLRKKLQAAGNRNGHERLKKWTRAILNHLYYCASKRATEPAGVTVDRWQSTADHIQNIHEFPSRNFNRCEHGPAIRNTVEWLPQGMSYVSTQLVATWHTS